MRIILVLDDSNGMLFNRRRQSSDIAVISKIKKIVKEGMLYLNGYSAGQFEDTGIRLCVDEGFLKKAGRGEYCFVENEKLSGVKDDIEGFVIFRWNRKYPGDFMLDVLPEECGMVCISVEDFEGHSHDRITMEVWRKES